MSSSSARSRYVVLITALVIACGGRTVVQTLKTITTTNVQWIRHYDGLTATARWGLDHGQGVIFVSTSRRAGPSEPWRSDL